MSLSRIVETEKISVFTFGETFVVTPNKNIQKLISSWHYFITDIQERMEKDFGLEIIDKELCEELIMNCIFDKHCEKETLGSIVEYIKKSEKIAGYSVIKVVK